MEEASKKRVDVINDDGHRRNKDEKGEAVQEMHRSGCMVIRYRTRQHIFWVSSSHVRASTSMSGGISTVGGVTRPRFFGSGDDVPSPAAVIPPRKSRMVGMKSCMTGMDGG